MTKVRVLMGGAVIVFCAAFVPVGSCAKGCSKAGRAGASHSDDFARMGGRSIADDLARSGRYTDDLAHSGRLRGVSPGAISPDDVAHLAPAHLEARIAALPEAEGAVSSIARKPSTSGATLGGLDDAGRNFGKDYAKSVDDLALTEKQHESLMDAFETAQDLASEVLDALDDEDDSEPRARLQRAARDLEMNLALVLDPEQLRKFRARHGSAEVVVYRLGKDRPIHPNGDKVAP